MAPYRPDRQMLSTVMTDHSTLQITNETLPRHRYCHRHRLDDDSRTSLAELPSWSAAHAGEKHRCGRWRRCVCVRSIRATCRVLSIGSPVSLAVEQKPSKDNRNKNLNTSFTNSKSESDLKTCKRSSQNGRVDRHFLLYSAVS